METVLTIVLSFSKAWSVSQYAQKVFINHRGLSIYLLALNAHHNA